MIGRPRPGPATSGSWWACGGWIAACVLISTILYALGV